MSRLTPRALILATFATLTPHFSAYADAATPTWKLPVSGSWTVASNWSTNAVPGLTDNVTIAATGSPYTVTLSATTSVASFSLTSLNATLSLTGQTSNTTTGALTTTNWFNAGTIDIQATTTSALNTAAFASLNSSSTVGSSNSGVFRVTGNGFASLSGLITNTSTGIVSLNSYVLAPSSLRLINLGTTAFGSNYLSAAPSSSLPPLFSVASTGSLTVDAPGTVNPNYPGGTYGVAYLDHLSGNLSLSNTFSSRTALIRSGTFSTTGSSQLVVTSNLLLDDTVSYNNAAFIIRNTNTYSAFSTVFPVPSTLAVTHGVTTALSSAFPTLSSNFNLNIPQNAFGDIPASVTLIVEGQYAANSTVDSSGGPGYAYFDLRRVHVAASGFALSLGTGTPNSLTNNGTLIFTRSSLNANSPNAASLNSSIYVDQKAASPTNSATGFTNAGTMRFEGYFASADYTGVQTISGFGSAPSHQVTGTVYNAPTGLIQINAPTVLSSADFNLPPLDNSGTINIANSASLAVGGYFNPSAGTINIAAGSALIFNSSFTGTTNNPAVVFNMTGGVINNSGEFRLVIPISTSTRATAVQFNGGTIAGTVHLVNSVPTSGPRPAIFRVGPNAQISNVILEGNWFPDAPIPASATITLGVYPKSGDITARPASMQYISSSTPNLDGTLTNSGKIIVESTGIPVISASTLINHGTISITAPPANHFIFQGSKRIYTPLFINETGATLNIDGIGFLYSSGINPSGGSIVNRGAINIGPSANTSLASPVLNQGTITVDHATKCTLGSSFRNEGTLTNYGGTVTFGGSFVNVGTYISDPAFNGFNDLSILGPGSIAAGQGDIVALTNDLVFLPADPSLSDLSGAQLQFFPGDDNNHALTTASPLTLGSLVLNPGQILTIDGPHISPIVSTLMLDNIDGSPTPPSTPLIVDTLILQSSPTLPLAHIDGSPNLYISYNSLQILNPDGSTTTTGPGLLQVPEPASLPLLLTPTLLLTRRRHPQKPSAQ